MTSEGVADSGLVEQPACHTLPGDLIRRGPRLLRVVRVEVSGAATTILAHVERAGADSGEAVSLALPSMELVRRVDDGAPPPVAEQGRLV